MVRPTEAVVDLGALSANVERLCALAAPSEVCVVTKADGYGHGSVASARAAIDAGAAWIAVALVEEGTELRRAGIRAPILLLSEPRPGEMFEVVEFGLTPTIYTPAGIAALVSANGLAGDREPVSVHIGVDTGMNRVGIRPQDELGQEVPQIVQAIAAKPGIRIGGVWTHFAVADEPDRPETAEQVVRFRAVLNEVARELPDDVIVHASNSAGLLAHPDARFDMVRVGIASYGIAPAPALDGVFDLTPVMSLRTEVGFIKTVDAGDRLSYGLRHEFDRSTRVATIPIGYADGLRRDAWERGVSVLVGGRKCPIVGVVTMDQTMVDLGPDASEEPGEEVVLIGHQGDQTITAADLAQAFDTIPYAVVCDIGRRVRRRYL